MKKIKVLSIIQPWAWCIFNAGKNVENRTWKTNYRGELYIHASKNFDYFRYPDLLVNNLVPQNLRVFEQGGIIGKVHLVCCIKNYVSSWSEKNKWNWILEKPETTIFKSCRDMPGIFDLEVDWI